MAIGNKTTIGMTDGMTNQKPYYRMFMTWVAGNNMANLEMGILALKDAVQILNTEYAGYEVVSVTHMGRNPEHESQGFLYLLKLRDA
jgi:hypothetical protein